MNAFSFKLYKSTATTDYRLSDEGKNKKVEKLKQQKRSIIENAGKGIYYKPYVFSGQCAGCGNREPWQRTHQAALGLTGILLPIALVILCFVTGVRLWLLGAAAGVWAVIKLLYYLNAKSASDRCQSLEAESRPQLFESENELAQALQSRFPDEQPTENKKVFAVLFWSL